MIQLTCRKNQTANTETYLMIANCSFQQNLIGVYVSFQLLRNFHISHFCNPKQARTLILNNFRNPTAVHFPGLELNAALARLGEYMKFNNNVNYDAVSFPFPSLHAFFLCEINFPIQVFANFPGTLAQCNVTQNR